MYCALFVTAAPQTPQNIFFHAVRSPQQYFKLKHSFICSNFAKTSYPYRENLDHYQDTQSLLPQGNGSLRLPRSQHWSMNKHQLKENRQSRTAYRLRKDHRKECVLHPSPDTGGAKDLHTMSLWWGCPSIQRNSNSNTGLPSCTQVTFSWLRSWWETINVLAHVFETKTSNGSHNSRYSFSLTLVVCKSLLPSLVTF